MRAKESKRETCTARWTCERDGHSRWQRAENTESTENERERECASELALITLVATGAIFDPNGVAHTPRCPLSASAAASAAPSACPSAVSAAARFAVNTFAIRSGRHLSPGATLPPHSIDPYALLPFCLPALLFVAFSRQLFLLPFPPFLPLFFLFFSSFFGRVNNFFFLGNLMRPTRTWRVAALLGVILGSAQTTLWVAARDPALTVLG